MLKCARCRRVFPAPGHAAPARGRHKPKTADENLSFSFDDDDEWRAPELTSDDLSEDAFLLNAPAESDPDPAPPRPRRPRPPRPLPGQESLRFDAGEDDADAPDEAEDDREPARDRGRDDDALEEEDEPVAPAAGRRRGADDDLSYELGEPAAPARVEAVKGGISVRSVFVFLAVIVGGYGALTWTLLDDPTWARRLTQSLPVIGKTMRESNAGADVALSGVEGHYERTKDGQAVFVITGTAENHSAESLRAVQIQATLFDASGRRLQEQTAPCGNALEARIPELSEHQVSILRSIKPPPNFSLQPGGRCPFVSIFLDLPAGAATYSTRVARAQGQA